MFTFVYIFHPLIRIFRGASIGSTEVLVFFAFSIFTSLGIDSNLRWRNPPLVDHHLLYMQTILLQEAQKEGGQKRAEGNRWIGGRENTWWTFKRKGLRMFTFDFV